MKKVGSLHVAESEKVRIQQNIPVLSLIWRDSYKPRIPFYYYTARNIEHPTTISWDVSFAPGTGVFYARGYSCMSAVMPNPTKIHDIAYVG